MSHHPRLLRTLLLLPTLAALGCGSPASGSDPVLVGPDAKLDGDIAAAAFLCRIERGDSDDPFFRVDTLLCEAPEGAVFVPAIDVWANGAVAGSLRLSDGPGSLRFQADQYPIEIRAYGYLSEELAGISAVRLDSTLTVESEAGWESSRGPVLPFEIWSLELESRVSVAQLTFEPYRVRSADGVRFTDHGAEVEVLEVRPQDLVIRATESSRVSFVAPSDGSPLRGSVTVDGAAIPFELDRGGALTVTREGLVPRQGLEPVAAGGALVRCASTGSGSSCALVGRAGITLSEASVTADGASHALPLDGAAIEVPPAASLSARAVVASGIEGLDLARFGAIEGELEDIDGALTLSLPFDLLHATVSVPAGDVADFTADHVVTFGRPIAGLYESSDYLSVRFSETQPDAWIAVSPGVTEILGALDVFTASGALRQFADIRLSEGTFEVTSEGLVVPSPVEAGTELARCWIEDDGALACRRLESSLIESATLNILLESHGYDLPVTLGPGSQDSIIDLDAHFPVTLTLEVRLHGGASQTATARATSAADLTEANPMIVLAL